MKTTSARLLLVIILALLPLTGCASFKKQQEEAKKDRESVTNTETLISYLSKRGISMMDNGPFSSPAMSSSGREYQLMSGGQLLVFQYNKGHDALQNVSWVGDRDREMRDRTYVFRKDTLVVVTVGDNPRLHRALVRVMGSPIS